MTAAPLVPVEQSSANGAREAFRRLRMAHRRVLGLHLRGHTAENIAKVMALSEGTVRAVLRRDDAKRVLQSAYTERIAELLPRAVATVNRHLDSGDGQVALRAADIALKLNGKYTEADQAQVTAEDVIERVLERITPDGTRTRLSERRLVRTPMAKETVDE